VKEFLSQKGISFKEIEVSQDRNGRDEMIRISGQRGVPVIVINNKVIIGFNRQAIEENLR
jgi:glutaredoxin 3